MNCHICSKYCNCKESVCNLRIKTMPNRDPNDTRFWSIDPAPKDMDPVLNNVYNGGWLCNYEPRQTNNNKICRRSFYDQHIIAPYNYGNVVDIDSNLRSLNQPLNNYCVNKPLDNNNFRPNCFTKIVE